MLSVVKKEMSTSNKSSRKLQANISWILIFPEEGKTAGTNVLSAKLPSTPKGAFYLCGVQAHLFAGGRERKRTFERRCRRRKSRKTSPVRPAEAEWGSAPGCSSLDPMQNEGFVIQLLKEAIILITAGYDGNAHRLSEVALSCYVIQAETDPGLMQPH